MIPALDPTTGCLPRGIYDATWSEIVDHFATGEHRSTICKGLETALQILRAAGARHVYLGGSFVTAKADPSDFDGCFDDRETFEWKRYFELAKHVPNRLPGHLAPESDTIAPGEDRAGPSCIEFLQEDPRKGIVKGVVLVNLDSVPQPIEGSPAWWAIKKADDAKLRLDDDGQSNVADGFP